jgi:hypothetical protein
VQGGGRVRTLRDSTEIPVDDIVDEGPGFGVSTAWATSEILRAMQKNPHAVLLGCETAVDVQSEIALTSSRRLNSDYFFAYRNAIWYGTSSAEWVDVMNVLFETQRMDASGQSAWFCVVEDEPRRSGPVLEVCASVRPLAVGLWANQGQSVKLWLPA